MNDLLNIEFANDNLKKFFEAGENILALEGTRRRFEAPLRPAQKANRIPVSAEWSPMGRCKLAQVVRFLLLIKYPVRLGDIPATSESEGQSGPQSSSNLQHSALPMLFRLTRSPTRCCSEIAFRLRRSVSSTILSFSCPCFGYILLVLFCFVLFCFVSFRFVLFCFVLFCFVLFCFVLFCFVLFCFVLFCFVLFCFVLFCFVLFCFVLFCFVLFCFVLFCFVLFCFVLFCFVLFCLLLLLMTRIRHE